MYRYKQLIGEIMIGLSALSKILSLNMLIKQNANYIVKARQRFAVVEVLI